MQIDATHHPFVCLHYNTAGNSLEQIDSSLHAFLQLLEREQPFVFISDGNPGDNTQSEEEQAAYRRKISLWMKSNKEAIRHQVKGQVHVAASAQEAHMMEEFKETFLKFWGFPLFVAHTPEEAQDKAAALLQGTE